MENASRDAARLSPDKQPRIVSQAQVSQVMLEGREVLVNWHANYFSCPELVKY